MPQPRWERIEEVFHRLLALPSEERAALLDSLCRDEPDVGAEVRSLLQAHGQAEEFLKNPTVDATGKRLAFSGDESWAGRMVGAYLLLRELGRGGMGRVYLAQRQDREFERLVAVKLIEPSSAGRGFLQRFRRERQILANLCHPNIAQLYEGGSMPDGTLYSVMELVDGLPIDEYCDRRRLSVGRRLELFRRVCEAVQHAHRSLVIHRDLKPGNILVTADGQPKLLDFGIAKPLSGQGRAPDEVTRTEMRVLTPLYASPEQLLGEPVTTASDVYSLGVLLYKLLTGAVPRRFDSFAPAEAAQAFQREIPPPSLAVLGARRKGRDSAMPSPEEIARSRRANPAKLSRALRGDLDNIALKALRPEPRRRYPSADRLEQDLGRYANGLPVEARPDSRRYRAAKFVQRHRTASASALLLFLVVLGFAAAMMLQAWEVARQRDRAALEAQKAGQVLELLVDLFEQADPGRTRGQSLTVREVMDEAAGLMESRLTGQPEVRAALMDAVGAVYLSLAVYGQARTNLEQALEIRQRLHPEGHADVVQSHLHLAELERADGNFEIASSHFRNALMTGQRVLGHDDPRIAWALHGLGSVLRRQGKLPEAEKQARRALALRQTIHGNNSAQVADSANSLAAILLEQRRSLAEAEQLLLESRDTWRDLGRLHNPKGLTTLRLLGTLFLEAKGDQETAEKFYREALAAAQRLYQGDHPEVATSLDVLGNILNLKGDLNGAENALRTALEMRKRLYGSQHLAVAVSLFNLGNFLLDQKDDAETAQALFKESYNISQGVAPEQPGVAFSLLGLGVAAARQGKFEQSEAHLREAIQIWVNAFSESDPRAAEARSHLGATLTAMGRYSEAEEQLQQACSVLREASMDPRAPAVAVENLIRLYEAWGKPEKALKYKRILEAPPAAAARR